MSLSVGTTLGHYDVTALIGEGGMGEVYRARDTKLDRDVALKVLWPPKADELMTTTKTRQGFSVEGALAGAAPGRWRTSLAIC